MQSATALPVQASQLFAQPRINSVSPTSAISSIDVGPVVSAAGSSAVLRSFDCRVDYLNSSSLARIAVVSLRAAAGRADSVTGLAGASVKVVLRTFV